MRLEVGELVCDLLVGDVAVLEGLADPRALVRELRVRLCWLGGVSGQLSVDLEVGRGTEIDVRRPRRARLDP